MELGSVMLLTLICVVARCFIFYKREIKWWKSLIPGYNKYILGKLSDSKKLGIINAIVQPLFTIYFFVCFCYEVWIIQTYAQLVKIPTDGVSQSKIQVAVPEDVAHFAVYSKYGLLVFGIIAFISWCIMMILFTKVNRASYWWILLWAAIPVIPYCYFAARNSVYMNGKYYKMQKIEISKNDISKKETKNKKDKDNIFTKKRRKSVPKEG